MCIRDRDNDNNSASGKNNIKKILSGTEYYDSLGYDLGTMNMLFNGESSVYPQYMRAMSERGQLEGSKIANQYLMASIGMENLGKDKIKSIYTCLLYTSQKNRSYRRNPGEHDRSW